MVQYTLQDIVNITFDGFDFTLPNETIQLIQDLASQVGSPSYIKTPVFQKRERELIPLQTAANSGFKKKRNNNRGMEVVSDNDWESLRTFHATKIEQKVGLDAEIDQIRSFLNKMSDKNFHDMKTHIMDLLEKLNKEPDDMNRVSVTIFEIASTNRFFSKLYADLYCCLIDKYDIMHQVFENSFESFMDLFSVIEYVDPDVDYNKFCKINKDNEKRKALSAFYVNLCGNGILSVERLTSLIHGMLSQVMQMIVEDNMKYIVDEMTENIAILYNKTQIETEFIDGLTVEETIKKLAGSKAKTYPSLSNKAIFKYMDIIDM